jgi:hypothetical protein
MTNSGSDSGASSVLYHLQTGSQAPKFQPLVPEGENRLRRALRRLDRIDKSPNTALKAITASQIWAGKATGATRPRGDGNGQLGTGGYRLEPGVDWTHTER